MNRASVEWTFFCITPLGLEELALQELDEKKTMLGTEHLSVKLMKGGFEVSLPWEQGRGLVHILKIPTRVLVRLGEFKARDFAKAFNKLKSLPWNKWISHPLPHFEVSASECRLIQTTRMKEVCEDALKTFLKAQPLSIRYEKESIQPETVYLRGHQDEWTLSLDLCGEPLYKRGLSLIKDLAPLRENLAAAALYAAHLQLKREAKLWDPMCGSGTFVFEALHFYDVTHRCYSYEKSILNLGLPTWKPKSLVEKKLFPFATGSDLKKELVEKLEGDFFQQDFFEAPKAPKDCDFVIMNPPYGERIKLAFPVKEFQQKIVSTLSKLKIPYALIVKPLNWPPFTNQDYSTTPLFRVSNGGIEVEMVYFQRRA